MKFSCSAMFLFCSSSDTLLVHGWRESLGSCSHIQHYFILQTCFSVSDFGLERIARQVFSIRPLVSQFDVIIWCDYYGCHLISSCRKHTCTPLYHSLLHVSNKYVLTCHFDVLVFYERYTTAIMSLFALKLPLPQIDSHYTFTTTTTTTTCNCLYYGVVPTFFHSTNLSIRRILESEGRVRVVAQVRPSGFS